MLTAVNSCHMSRMKLSTWAKRHGVSYKTAWSCFHAGTLPVRAEQMQSGTVLAHEDGSEKLTSVALYARVSSHKRSARCRATKKFSPRTDQWRSRHAPVRKAVRRTSMDKCLWCQDTLIIGRQS